MKEKHVVLPDLEEKLMMIPLVIAVVLSLISLVLSLAGQSDASSAFGQYSYYAYAWICCIGLGSCVKTGNHLRINIFGDKYPESVNKFLEVLNSALEIIVIAALFIGSVILLSQLFTSGEEELSAIALIAIYGAPIVGYGLGVFRWIEKRIVGGK